MFFKKFLVFSIFLYFSSQTVIEGQILKRATVAGDGCGGDPCIRGTCIPFDDGSYACDCPEEYLGINCTELTDPCSLSPCQSGGTCVARGDAEYDCFCPIPYTGEHCEDEDLCLIELDECVDNLFPGPKCYPCQTNESCYKIGPDNYSCDFKNLTFRGRSLVSDDDYPFENMLIPGIVIGCLLVYLLILAGALVVDYLSKIQPRLILMGDLLRIKEDTFYLLTVETGYDPFAGTSARIYCVIFGDLDKTKVLVLNNYLLDSMQQNDDVDFLISTPNPLGNILKIQIWIDPDELQKECCKVRPFWYNRNVIIRNIKTEQIWYFFVRKWISFRRGHSAVELPVATRAEVASFYSTKVSLREYCHQLREHHIWIHVVTAPSRSTYSRAERITSAAGLWFSYMFFVLLLYGIPEDLQHYQSKKFHHEVSFESYYPIFAIGTKSSLIGIVLGYIFTISFRFIRRQKIPALIVWDSGGTGLSTKTVRVQTEPVALPSIGQESENILPFQIPSTDMLESEDWIDRVTTDPEELLECISNHKPYPDCFIHNYQNGRDNGRISKLRKSSRHRKHLKSRATAARLSSLTEALNDSISEPVVIFQKKHRRGLEHFRTKFSQQASSPHRKEVVFEDEPPILKLEEKVVTIPAGGSIGDTAKVEKLVDLTSKSETSTVVIEKADELKLELCNIEHNLERHHCLPHWFLWIAWIVPLTVIAIFSTVLIFYGIRFSWAKSLNWLASFCWALLESIFVFQPIKALIAYTILLYKRRIRHDANPDEFDVKLRFKLLWISGEILPFQKWPLYYLIHPLFYNGEHELDDDLYPFPLVSSGTEKLEPLRPVSITSPRPSKVEWLQGVGQKVSVIIQKPLKSLKSLHPSRNFENGPAQI